MGEDLSESAIEQELALLLLELLFILGKRNWQVEVLLETLASCAQRLCIERVLQVDLLHSHRIWLVQEVARLLAPLKSLWELIVCRKLLTFEPVFSLVFWVEQFNESITWWLCEVYGWVDWSLSWLCIFIKALSFIGALNHAKLLQML